MVNQVQRNVLTCPGTTRVERENEHDIPKSHMASSRPAEWLFILLGRDRCLTRVELLLVSTLFVLPAWQRSLASGPHRSQKCWVNTKRKDGPCTRDMTLGRSLWTRLSQLIANISKNCSGCWDQCPSPQALEQQQVLTPPCFSLP